MIERLRRPIIAIESAEGRRPEDHLAGRLARGRKAVPPLPVVQGRNSGRARAGTTQGEHDADRRAAGRQEDLAGLPFVGPAGRLLDEALAAAGIDRKRVFVTNAVKHFKYERRGKRRLHKRPNAHEIDRCRWWQDMERAIVKPTIIVAMGATAGPPSFDFFAKLRSRIASKSRRNGIGADMANLHHRHESDSQASRKTESHVFSDWV